MAKYAKAFVSHSSSDKPLLEKIVKKVAAARWEIDSRTFEDGGTSADQIFQSMSRSDLFVLLASEKSKNSRWVQSELEVAQSLYYSNKIGDVLVFIIDDVFEVNDLPEWIRLHVFVKTNNETRIANAIRAKLFKLDIQKGNEQKPFVSRILMQDQLEKRLADLTSPASVIYVSGIDGIGRRAVVTHVLSTLFPGNDVTGIDVSLTNGEGALELYRKIYLEWNKLKLSDVNVFFEETSELNQNELISKIVELVNKIGDSKSFIWLQCDFSTLNEDGNFEPYLKQLFTQIDIRRPTLIVRTRRFPHLTEQTKLNRVAFFKVESLSDDESRRLWSFALAYHQFQDADEKLILLLQDHLSGHPGMIWTAAEYVTKLGKAAIQTNTKDLIDTLRELSLSLLDGLTLTATAKKLLSLFDEFGTISSGDLLSICDESDQAIAMAIGLLFSFGLVESDGEYMKLASFFQNARFRRQFSKETDAFLVEARKRLLSIVSNYADDDNITFATIDNAIMIAISQGKQPPFSERAIVGSHYLKVARSFYDRDKHVETIKFARCAISKRETLTESARIESLRLLGMAAIRADDSNALAESMNGLAQINNSRAKRHIHFILGFEARWNGNAKNAEEEFRRAHDISGNDVHVLRELANILLIKEDYIQAEKFAREAKSKAPANPYILDMLLHCLIERTKGNQNELRQNQEINELFDQLEVADRREHKNFTKNRRAHLFLALKKPLEALQFADDAVRARPNIIEQYAVRADIKLALKNDAKILHSTEVDIKKIQDLINETKGAKRYITLLTRLRIKFALAKGDIRSAFEQYDNASNHLGQLRSKLAHEIADQIVQNRVKDADMVDWANSVMASN